MNRAFLFGLLLTVVGCLAGAQPVAAQTSISPEQMRMFQSLSPAQQQAIMQQLGMSSGDAMSVSTGASGAAGDSGEMPLASAFVVMQIGRALWRHGVET